MRGVSYLQATSFLVQVLAINYQHESYSRALRFSVKPGHVRRR